MPELENLDALKSDPGVLRIYGSFLKLRKGSNGTYTGLCCLHSEKSPSFTVYPDMRFQCFGCGVSGNIFQLVEKVEGIGFKEAVERVKRELGKSDSGWEKTKERVESTFREVAEPKSYKTVPLQNFQKLETALAGNTVALQYLQSRGITLETAKKLHLGYAQTIGNLAYPDGADIADKGWMAFPCVEGDTVVSIKYRSLVRKKPGGFCRAGGMATALFNTEDIDVFEPIYLVEGEYDCAALVQAGFHAVSVPSAGVKLSAAHKDQIMRASCVILAGDSDPTGAGYMASLWKSLGERTYLLAWPEGCKDANETFLKSCGGEVDKFRALVEELTSKAKSVPMPDIYSIQEAMRNGEETSLSDRPDRLRFPWSEVDKAAILLPGSVLGVMATSSSMGKTALALQYSLFGARKHNEVVVNWQCELSPAEISVMVAAQVLHKNRNFLTKDDLKLAADQLNGVEYYVGNNPAVSRIEDVLDIMEAAIRRLGATQAVLDNIHYYVSGVDDDVRVLAGALKRIKQIAVTYGCKFSVVFQPRKANQQSRGKKTQLSDIKGSATAGDTCDAVLAIHRDLIKNSDGEETKNDIYEEKTLAEWLKIRSKGVGKASTYIHFFGEFAEFAALETHHEEPSE